MKTQKQMDKLTFTCLLIFTCFLFLSVNGTTQDEFSSCEVRLLAKRGMIVTAAPNRSVTVECPVHHCGKTLNVSWCKVLPSDECEPINDPEHEEISQRSQPSGDKLISSLSFKHISTHDDGLYRCELKGHNHYEHSHLINISVSASYQGVQTVFHNDAGAAARVSAVAQDVQDESWLLYFYSCVCIGILAATLIVLSIFRFYGRKGVFIVNQKVRREETYTNTLPGLPKTSAPSISVLPTNFQVLHEKFSHTTVHSASQPYPTTFESQPATAVANPSEERLNADNAVYAAINHRQAERPARELQGRTTNKNTEYASIVFVNSQ